MAKNFPKIEDSNLEYHKVPHSESKQSCSYIKTYEATKR